MSEPMLVNAQVVNTLNVLNHATMDAATVLASGSGKAFQSVAQSAAIAIQDATDALRNASTIATTAAGVALAQYMATGDEKYANALTKAQSLMTSATTDYAAIGAAATVIVQQFPFGKIPSK
jgi:hypothetical protein